MDERRRLIEGAAMPRRHCIAALLGCAAAGSWAAPARSPVLLVVGDSLSAEYGLRRGTGWVALLQARLAERKEIVQIVNASISGETSSGGRSRLAALLTQHRPTHVIIELGANDALRGLPLTMTEANLRAMVQAVRQAGAKALLIGMQVPPNYGGAYTRDFSALFGKIAKSERAAVVPFLLAGLADDADPRRWFQPDGLHPVEAAHPRILDTVWPVVGPWLTR